MRRVREGLARGARYPDEQLSVRELPIVVADVGPDTGPVIVIHGHIDVVPGREGHFDPTWTATV